jgi:hypothetical protein
LVCLIVVIGPVTWFGIGLLSGVGFVAQHLDSGLFPIPMPPDSVEELASYR